jgi:signal transduction histidine kinase
MNDYARKRYWKVLLLLFAMLIGAFSLWYTHVLVQKLSAEEEKKIQQWAEATELIVSTGFMEDFSALREADTNQYRQLDLLMNEVNNFLSNIQKQNVTIPVILTDENDQIISHRNLNSDRSSDSLYLAEQLSEMKSEHPPIVIALYAGSKNYIYYKNSLLLTQLRYYPYFQLSVIALFILVSYLAFSASRRSEQNRVWVGMSKETAHQLGTPISSLMAWMDMLRQEHAADEHIVNEMEKDIARLNIITERFSKIGSAPALQSENLVQVITHAVNYLQSRSSSKVRFALEYSSSNISAPVNVPLFEWVIENLTKNAIDAMDGIGAVTFSIRDEARSVVIDVTDTGKGIPKARFKTVFNPGYTTKKRGWGLGLSLVKRIVEDYHKGSIVVHQSELNKGTTFRIILQK